MADYERTVLEYYQLSTAYPVEWPAEKDNSDSSDGEETGPVQNGIRKSKSRYSALERAASDRRSVLPGSQRGDNGVDNMVQRDEPDPLGSTDSVVKILRQLGLPVQEDPSLRNRFLLSSTTFSPALFLSQVHSAASTQSLVEGLNVLSRSIDQKSASLKVLVESNFERFVRAKATIDNVYTEMKYPAPDARKKNALTKESEYGVLGIKTPLLDVSAKAEEVWGPALGGREKEDSFKIMSGTVDRYKELYEVGAAITDGIKRRDYESIVEEYTKARRFSDDARKLSIALGSTHPTDAQIFQLLLAARVWNDVEEQIEEFKREIWRRLIVLQSASLKTGDMGDPQDQHMELIGVLLELGVTDNPIWAWLSSRYDHLKSKIQTTSERSKIEIEILRRRLANSERPATQIIASYLRSLSRQTVEDKPTSVDSLEIIDLWEKMHTFLSALLGGDGILGEVVEYWQTIRSFIDGKAQKLLPVGVDGESRKHHKLSDQDILDLQNGIVELIDLIRESVFTFFAEPPIEDISSLGEAWEKHAFWPPWSNSLSGVHYLGKLLVLVGTGASEMAAISAIEVGDGSALERLKGLVGEARERCVIAICAAWNKDAENIKVLEDWRRSPEKRDLTKMPAYFGAFESAVLTGMQKILYISEAMSKSDSTNVVFPPPAKLLQMVRSQFVTTLYRSLSGMVENAEKAVKKAEDDWTTDNDGLASPVAMNVRMLLTLSNLQALRTDVVPNLTTQFENAFSVKLTEETKTIRDVLGQIDARLFQSYTRPAVNIISAIVRSGISSPDWSPGSAKPREVRAYIYEALLSLVLVHTQVSTTASTLTTQVLSFLLEQTSRELLEAFKARQRYSLSELMQATLDLEFVAQTLSQYTTERASEIQSQIYQELDKGTDNEARSRLQGELPEMRAVLKRLREGSRSEFACFKKSRRVDRPSAVLPLPQPQDGSMM
ncbi:hypothetical protein PZA11_001999 [Diplocarpon coronariae]